MYLIDTNTLIDAKNRYYHFDICPGFWKAILTNNNIKTIEMVIQEIKDGKDELKDWIIENEQIIKTKLIEIDNKIQQNFIEIADYVENNLKLPPISEKERFLSKADPWLIATAKEYDYTVVTQEQFINDSKTKKIKIPNICTCFNVKYISLFDLLKQENIQFCLKDDE